MSDSTMPVHYAITAEGIQDIARSVAKAVAETGEIPADDFAERAIPLLIAFGILVPVMFVGTLPTEGDELQ